MTCSSCKYLKEDKKYEGAVSGCKYYCSKFETYIDASQYSCEKYEKSYSRNNYTCDKMCDDGRNFYDDDRPLSFYIFMLIIIIVVGLIITITL